MIAAVAGLVLLLNTTTVAARLGDDRSLTVEKLDASESTAATEPSAERSPDGSPSPSATASPSPTPSAGATDEATPTSTSDGSSPAPTATSPADEKATDAEDPSPSPAPKRPEPSVTISIKPDSAQSIAGNPVRYEVRVDVGRDEPGTLTVNFGNGAVHELAKSDCFVGGTSRLCYIQHSYRVRGTYKIRAAWCWSCSWDRSWGYAETNVTSSSGPYLGNGNYQPSANRSFYAVNGQPRRLELKLTAQDADGCVTKLEVDWGDGSSTASMTYPESCRAPGSDAFAWTSWDIPRLGHTYAAEDEYVVTITVHSTAPGGGEAQSSVLTEDVTIPYDAGIPSTG